MEGLLEVDSTPFGQTLTSIGFPTERKRSAESPTESLFRTSSGSAENCLRTPTCPSKALSMSRMIVD